MARPPKKAPPPSHYKMVFGAAAGRGAADFFVLGYCHALDELEIARDPEHEEFTWIFHFVNGERKLVAKIPKRIDDLWLGPSGIVYGVGRPRGVLEIKGMACAEVAINIVPGTFSALWGHSEDHLFGCGHHDIFLLYRRLGKWMNVPLPTGVGGLWGVSGLSEQDVYVVGDQGDILHFDGRQVTSLDSPTTRWLTSVVPMLDGRLCIAGYSGVLLYGNRRGWRFIDTGTDEPLLSLASYRNGVCFVTPDGLFWFDGATSPQLLVRQGGRWVNGLGDVVMIVDGESSWLFDGAGLMQLDTTL